ncbi:MAG: branched-chain amino acid ABC transporter permease [Acetanaerobacterium sp.]
MGPSARPKARIRASLINTAGVLALFVVLVIVKESGLLNNYIQGIIVQSCYAIIMVASLNIATGFLGQLALGHAGFMALGAYTSALVTKAIVAGGVLTGGDVFSNLLLFVIGALSGASVAALFGIVVGIPALRLRGDYLAIITLGFGEIIRVVIQNLPFAGGKGLADGQAGQALIGIKNLANIYTVFFLTVITLALLFSFVRSKYGRAIMAIREDDIASEASGINNTYYKVLAFTISAFFAGIAGAIFAHRGLGTLQHSDFTFLKSTEYVIMVVLGGMGSLTGSIIAAIALSALPEALRAFSQYRMLVYSVVLVLMMIFRPIGLCGKYEFSLTRIIDGLPTAPQRFREWSERRKRKSADKGKGVES